MPTTDHEASRPAFEAIAFPHFREYHQRGTNGDYAKYETRIAWIAWKAALVWRDSQVWKHADEELPADGEWVLHTYYGARAPEYGLFQNGRFFGGGGSLPTTHWMAIPELPTGRRVKIQPTTEDHDA